MSALTDFLLARIAEDEAVARAAAPGPWEYQDVDSVGGGRVCDPTVNIADLFYEQPGTVDPRIRREVHSEEADATGWHIVRWDPARVLARCKADRRIVELAQDYSPELEHGDNGEWALDAVLRHLALPYVDHPDYAEATR